MVSLKIEDEFEDFRKMDMKDNKVTESIETTKPDL